MTPPLDVAAIRARLEAATPGPWAIPNANVFRVIAPDAEHHNPKQGRTPPYPWRIVADMGDEGTAAADATFIAYARTDIPALLDALAERDARIAELEAAKWRCEECRAPLQAGGTGGVCGVCGNRTWERLPAAPPDVVPRSVAPKG